MSPPTPAPPGDDLSGLGTPTARLFLLVPSIPAALYTAATWPDLARPGLAAVALGVLLAEILVISRPRPPADGPPAVLAATAPLATSVLVVLATAGDLGGRLWVVQMSGFYAALLLARGSARLSWTAASLQWAFLVGYGAATGQLSEIPAHVVLPASAMAVGVYWRRMLLANARSAERVRRAADETAALAAANRAAAARAFAQLADIRALTLGTLEDLHRTGAPSDDLRARSARLEITVREGLRAPRLAVEPVRGAVQRARNRGLAVRLLDDSLGAPVHPAVLDRITVALDGCAGGEVVVRLAPPGRAYTATVLMDDGDVHALRIAPDGR